MSYNDAYLEHHGVKGMKWGVRKSPQKRSSVRAKKQRSEYHQRDKMSDEQLRKKVERQRLENDYNRLTKEAIEQNQSRGRQAIRKVQKSPIYNTAISAAVSGAVIYGLNSKAGQNIPPEVRDTVKAKFKGKKK